MSNLHNSFKETQIGSIPVGWDICQLGEILELRGETILPQEALGTRYVGLEHIDPGNSKIRRWGIAEDVRSAKAHFYQDDILYGKLRPYLDKAALAEWEGICSTDILVFRTTSIARPDYMVHVLHSKKYLDYAIATTSGVNHPRTSWNALRELEIPLPPLPEQLAIAQVLTTVRQSIEATERVIATAREMKRSLMKYLFTYGPVPIDQADQVVLKETEIGEVPEKWPIVKLDSLLALSSGKTRPKALCDFPLQGFIYPVYGGNGIMGYSKDYLIDKSTIVLGRVGEYCGSVHTTEPKSWVSDNALYVKEFLRYDFDIRYLANVLELLNLNKFKKITGQPLITQGIVHEKSIPYPEIKIQQEVAVALRIMMRKVWVENNRKTALDSLFSSLLHHLMTGKIRIEHTRNNHNSTSPLKANNQSRLLERLIKLEEDVLYQELASAEQPEFGYVPGIIPILISAPHGAVHTRTGQVKQEDEFTAGFACLIGEQTGAHVIYLRRKTKSDPNWDSGVPYKTYLEKIIDENGVKFVLDIHGAREDRKFGIALGTLQGESCAGQRDKIVEVLNNFGYLGKADNDLLRVDIDNCFSGSGKRGQETIITYLHKLTVPVPAAQFELNANLRIPSRRSDASIKEPFQGNPILISQAVDAFVALVQALTQEYSSVSREE